MGTCRVRPASAAWLHSRSLEIVEPDETSEVVIAVGRVNRRLKRVGFDVYTVLCERNRRHLS